MPEIDAFEACDHRPTETGDCPCGWTRQLRLMANGRPRTHRHVWKFFPDGRSLCHCGARRPPTQDDGGWIMPEVPE